MMPNLACAVASAARMSSQLCNRASSSNRARSSGVPHRCAYCAESVRRAPTPAPVHPDMPFEQAALRQHSAGQSSAVSRADVDLVGALTVDVLVNLLRSLTADEYPGLAFRPLVQVRGLGTLDSESAAPARQKVVGRRSAPGQRLKRDDVGDELDRADALCDVEHPASLIDELG